MKRKFSKAYNTKETLVNAFEEFIEEKEATNRSKDTIRNYNLSFNIFYDYHELDTSTELEEINIQMFYKWINHMKNNEVRPSSINHYLRDWRTFFNWCYVREKIKEPLQIKEIKKQEELPKMYTDEEMETLLEKPRDGDSFSDWRMWALISTVYATGLRASSLCGMKIGDFDFKHEEIIIAQQKNKKAGILPFTPAHQTCIKEYYKRWLRDADDTDYAFPNIGGEQLTVNALRQAMDRYCKARGVKPHGIHSIRHNFSRAMIVNGGGEYRLQKYLQHSSIQMSQHYVKLFASDLKRDAEEFSPLDTAKKARNRKSQFKKGSK